jgi:hypothetical protein
MWVICSSVRSLFYKEHANEAILANVNHFFGQSRCPFLIHVCNSFFGKQLKFTYSSLMFAVLLSVFVHVSAGRSAQKYLAPRWSVPNHEAMFLNIFFDLGQKCKLD